jgi:hypothetical protein
MRKLEMWEINHLEVKHGRLVDTTISDDDDDDDGEEAKVLVPN